MIFCFSGTGNSRYIARKAAEALREQVTDLNAKIKAGDHSPIQTGRDVIVITPTYAWRIPRIASDWLAQTELTGAERVWFVMNCGSEIGNASVSVRRTTFGSKTANPSGARNAPIAWPASATVRRKPLNMGKRALGNRAISLKKSKPPPHWFRPENHGVAGFGVDEMQKNGSAPSTPRGSGYCPAVAPSPLSAGLSNASRLLPPACASVRNTFFSTS